MGPSGHRGFCRVCNYIVNYSVGPNQNIKAFIFKTSLQGSLWQRRSTLFRKNKKRGDLRHMLEPCTWKWFIVLDEVLHFCFFFPSSRGPSEKLSINMK